MPTTREMSDRHEADIAALLDGRVTVGSGNQHNDPMDGKHGYMSQRYTFAWDGKCSLANSISVSVPMWQKAVDQARAFRPLLALRLWKDTRLTMTNLDLIAVEANTFAEMLEDANRVPQLEADVKLLQAEVIRLKAVDRVNRVERSHFGETFEWDGDD